MEKQVRDQTRLGHSTSTNSAVSDSDAAEKKEKLQFRLFKLLLEKYSALINESERRTIGEIKGLVNAEDLTIQSILIDFKPKDYSFEAHFLEQAEKVFDFIVKEINFVESGLGLNYWLSPKDIFSEKLADDEDLAIFLCSLLLGLGNEKASVVLAELDNLQIHAFVAFEHNGKFFILDPSQKHAFSEFSGERDKVILEYSFNTAKIKQFLYKFNHSSYEQFVEQE